VLSRLLLRSHPRFSPPGAQVVVLLLAMALGCGVGLVLLAADRSSWKGAVETTATITGVDDQGVTATAGDKTVSLHLSPIPRTGSTLQVEVSPDGRARPVAYVQTPGRAIREGVALALLLAVLVQGYRYAVTRRPTSET
jgi:hypothetical protein